MGISLISSLGGNLFDFQPGWELVQVPAWVGICLCSSLGGNLFDFQPGLEFVRVPACVGICLSFSLGGIRWGQESGMAGTGVKTVCTQRLFMRKNVDAEMKEEESKMWKEWNINVM